MSEMNENDCEMLEAFLDQELSEEQQSGLRARLSSDEALASQLEQLRAERKTREELFTSFEGGEAAVVDRILGSLNAKNSPRNNLRRIFFAAAAAACIVLGFLIGWMGHTNGQSNAVAGEPPYRVEIVDETGQVMAVQKFHDLEKAREFQSDLQQWQVRQQRLLGGQVTIQSSRF